MSHFARGHGIQYTSGSAALVATVAEGSSGGSRPIAAERDGTASRVASVSGVLGSWLSSCC